MKYSLLIALVVVIGTLSHINSSFLASKHALNAYIYHDFDGSEVKDEANYGADSLHHVSRRLNRYFMIKGGKKEGKKSSKKSSKKDISVDTDDNKTNKVDLATAILTKKAAT